MEFLKLLIIEDDPNLREVCHDYAFQYFDEIFLASDLQEGIQQFSENDIHAILCDNVLPDGRGVDFLTAVRKEHPGLPCILTTGLPSYEIAVASANANVFQFLTKPFDYKTIDTVLEEFASRACRYLERRRLEQKFLVSSHTKKILTDSFHLTKRELEIIDYSLSGCCNDEIATILCISKATVKRHWENIFSKLNLHGKKEVFAMLVSLNLNRTKIHLNTLIMDKNC